MACNGMASSLYPPTASQMQTPHEHEEDPHHHHLPSSSSSLCPLPLQDCNYINAATLLGKRSTHWVRLGDRQACGEMINGEDELSDDCSHLGEKKRRLKLEQVRTLEKNFELGSRLEPERKMQLAAALGLQPRQIAIWFQNRRARWKTKQLEKDYDALKKQFEAVRSENDALQTYNKKLKAEIAALNGREMTSEPSSLNKLETEVSCSFRSDNSSDINLDVTRSTLPNAHATHLHHHCQKVEHDGGQDDAAGFCNMFYSLVDDQPAGVWTPWQEQPSFH